MISLIVPTRDRAYTLRKVLPSYFAQDGIDEIVLVIDEGSDDTEAVFAEIGAGWPDVRRIVLRNPTRLGASASRNRGAAAATNDFVLFCDDDEYLEAGYARHCLTLLQARGAGAVSGRRIYMREGESIPDALRRYGNGQRRGGPFNHLFCELRNRARFQGDAVVPFTNAIILTPRDLVLRYGFDEHYARGNGYREETDYQMNLFVNGYENIISNSVHSLHLPLEFVRRGGQRTSPFRRIYWMVHYTNYFYDKYYDRYAEKVGLRLPKGGAKLVFAAFAVYRGLVEPHLVRLAARLRPSKPAALGGELASGS